MGIRVELDHLRATAPGVAVESEAVLERIDSKKLTFMVSATDTTGQVPSGTVTRVVVEVERFMDKLQ